MTAWVLGGLLALALCVPGFRPEWVIRFRKTILAVVAGLSLLALGTLVQIDPPSLRLHIDPSTAPLLPLGDPARPAHERAVADFGDDEVYVVAVGCEAVFSPTCLTALEQTGQTIARMPPVQRVTHLMDATAYRYDRAEDSVVIRPFIEDVPSQPATLDDLRARAIRDPVYRRSLVSDDAKTAAFNVRFHDIDDPTFIARDVDGDIARALETGLAQTEGFYVAGRPHLMVAVYWGILSDLLRLSPLVALVMAGVLWAFMGHWRGVLAPLGSALVGLTWTLGILVASGYELNLITALLAPMLLAVGSVYGVHVVSQIGRAHV